ncbi:hypothetical protein EDD21DRAFT_349528 [Dissophora ornata]|nr:hypothetical protein EDD21DRAFT_349528 [Dissophora ornata]
MAQENVIRCILISSIGTDAVEKEQLNRFAQTEDKTILREGFPFQALFYWISMIQHQGVLGMSIKPNVEFSPLDINNLGDALVSVTFPARPVDHDHDYDHRRHTSDQSNSNHSESIHDDINDAPVLILDGLERFDGQIYTLTGPEMVTGPKLVDELNRALSSNFENGDDETEGSVHQQATRDELRAYLVSLRNKSQGALDESHQFQLQNMPGISGAIRLFQRATEAAFGGRRPQQGLTAICCPYEALTSEGEEGLDEGGGIEEVIAPDDGQNKDRKNPDDPCKCPTKDPQLEAPIDDEVDLILDLLDHINEGRAAFQSGDLKKVAGIRGEDATGFFERYAQDFRQRPRKDL